MHRRLALVITLDQVRCFVAVAEELHFGRAAERLQMTQPPLSRQIQKLERAVGAQLLERDNRRVELTGAGVAFLDEATGCSTWSTAPATWPAASMRAPRASSASASPPSPPSRSWARCSAA